MIKSNFKIIFVLGGVFSSIGKGIVSSSIGKLLKNNKLQVSMQKHDPYLNVDCGLMNPSEHGEIFTTQDGLETDLDLGNYERFLNQKMSVFSSITAGQVYQEILKEERNGKYQGKTINIYNVAEKIKEKIFYILNKEKSDCLVVELGGTIGDNDLKPFLIAAAQIQRTLGSNQVAFIFLTYIYYLKHLSEFKTKPAQNSIALLRNNGIEPDFVILRCSQRIPQESQLKISKFCYLPLDRLFVLPETNIYFVPLLLFKNQFFTRLLHHLQIPQQLKLQVLESFCNKINQLQESNKRIRIAIINKYPNFKQSYLSLHHAIYACSVKINVHIDVVEINPEKLNEENSFQILAKFDGIFVPGGFGARGFMGKITAIKFARQNKIPFFAVCLGFQIALIEFARNQVGLTSADSEEFVTDSQTKKKLIIKYFEPKLHTMIIGEQETQIKPKTLTFAILQKNKIMERHRNRLVFDTQYCDLFEQHGLIFSGSRNQGSSMEIIELKDHPFFLATQFHLEWNSRPETPHPLLLHFFQACYQYQLLKK